MGLYKTIFTGYYITIDNIQSISKEALELELTHISDMFRKKQYMINEFEHDIREYGVYTFMRARSKTSSINILENLNLCNINIDFMTTKELKALKIENKTKRKSGERFWVSYDGGKTKKVL